TVPPWNAPPTFELARDTVTVRYGQHVELEGFARDMSPGGGPDEAGQVLSFAVTHAGGNRLVVEPLMTREGTLRFDAYPLQLSPKTATYQVVLWDGGGDATGGRPVSEPQTFDIVIEDLPGGPGGSGGPGGPGDDDDDLRAP